MAPSLFVLAGVEVFIESLLYGVYSILFVSCINIILYKRKGSINAPLLSVSLALFTCITIHEVIDAGRFIWVIGSFSTIAEIDAWYAEGLTRVWNILGDAVLVIMVIISDLFLIYRCFVIWGRRWLVTALPFLVFICDMGTGIALPISQSQGGGSNAQNPTFAARQVRINTTFMASTFTVNVLCTVLIAYRILLIHYESRAVGSKSPLKLGSIAVIIVESGAIYLLATLFTLVTYTLKRNVNYVLVDVVVPIIGIVFSLIIIRVGLQISSETVNQNSRLTTISFSPAGPSESALTAGSTSRFGHRATVDLPVHGSSGELQEIKQANIEVIDTV